MKKIPKIEQKREKNWDPPKNGREDAPATFLGKHQIWGDFGVPGRSLGKALGRILGRNFGGGKNDEKTVVSVVASAGNADPGKEGFREDSQVGEMGEI